MALLFVLRCDTEAQQVDHVACGIAVAAVGAAPQLPFVDNLAAQHFKTGP